MYIFPMIPTKAKMRESFVQLKKCTQQGCLWSRFFVKCQHHVHHVKAFVYIEIAGMIVCIQDAVGQFNDEAN